MVRFTPVTAVILITSGVVLIAPVVSYVKFVETLPNGASVEGVAAVGHTKVDGGGPRNAFGKDYEEMGESWTMELCMTDSDGDGQTNGEELGDPCCEWSVGSDIALLWTSGVSNPGDDSRTSDKTLWPVFECSNATSSSSSQESDVGDEGSASTSDGASTSGSTTPAASAIAVSATAGFISLLLVLLL